MLSDLKEAVISTIKNSRETVASAADVGLSIIQDDSVASKIPVVSWAVAANEAVGTFRRERLRKNVTAFLDKVAQTPPADSADLIERLRSDKTFAEEFSEVTISVLLEAARPVKAEVLGNLTVALAKRELTKERYSELALMVEAASVPSLLALERHLDQHSRNALLSHHSINEPLLFGMGVANRYGTHLSISELGLLLYEYGFKKRRKESEKSVSI